MAGEVQCGEWSWLTVRHVRQPSFPGSQRCDQRLGAQSHLSVDLDVLSLRLFLGFGLLGSAGFMLGGGRGLRSWRSW